MADEGLSAFDIAAQSLSQSVREESGLPPENPYGLDVPAENKTDAPQTEQTPQVDAGTTSEEDSFTKLDPTKLAPELQQAYKLMQGDYTRTKQSLAEQRKALEGLDVDQAREAMDFYQALQTDPSYAFQVHQALTQSLQQAGYSLGDAQRAATNAINQQSDFGAEQMDGMYYGAGDFTEGPDPRDQMIQQLNSRLDAIEQASQYQDFAAQVQRQEMAVRQAHPDYTETDLQRIYSIAPSFDNDLVQADRAYQEWKSEMIADYLNQKSSVPSVGSPQSSVAHAQEPTHFADLNEAHKAAQAALSNILAEGGS